MAAGTTAPPKVAVQGQLQANHVVRLIKGDEVVLEEAFITPHQAVQFIERAISQSAQGEKVEYENNSPSQRLWDN